jgi:flagellar hook protein FlgE
LLTHQRKLDVVANNIANINTTGYKTQNVLFSDLLYTPLGQASEGTGRFQGGVNPKQIGHGVQVAEVTQDFSQGILTNTGEQFDFAIEGDGFFVVSGEQEKYTRDGSFSLDSNGYLVDAATGGYIQRTGVVGESINGELGFQVGGDARINVPLGLTVPGEATTEASFVGNLPSDATPPQTEVLITTTPFTEVGVAATDATLFNDLDFNQVDYVAGDEIEIVGTNADGSSFSVNLPADGALTVGDVVTAINGQLEGAVATLSAAGNIVVTADEVGESFLSLNLRDSIGNTGLSDFQEVAVIVDTEGKEGDKVQSTIQVFDSRGSAHPLNVTFEKLDDNIWEAEFTAANDSIQLPDGLVQQIIFDEDGGYQTINGTGIGDASIELQVSTLNEEQTIEISFDNLSHVASGYSTTFDQDGFPPGTIVSLNASSDGTMVGVATNGRQLDIAQLAVARFANNHGLESTGGNYYVQTSNSGLPSIGGGFTDGRGAIRGGNLETSNVDVAIEFTQLIVAQRGFSANARSMTVATEILQELNNIF